MGPEISFVIPCLNEELCLESVLQECFEAGEYSCTSFEVVVADNGSTDSSVEIAQKIGAKVINVPLRGYGEALRAGIAASDGCFVIMGDADGTYAFSDLPKFLDKLRSGCDLVMGNRFEGVIERGAMPPLHKYLGNPVLSFLGRCFFGITIGDFHCGLRAFRKASITSLKLNSSGMEFASEMVIKAALMNLSLSEVPTRLRRGHPLRRPHLRTWRDGWRHLKFMLSYSPSFSYLPLAFSASLLSVLSLALYSLQAPPFTGPNTLIAGASSYFMAITLLVEYVSNKLLINGHLSIDVPARGGRHWIRRMVSEKSINQIFRTSAIAFVAGIAVCALIFINGDIGVSSRLSNSLLFLSSCLITSSFSSYLLASRLSTAQSLGLFKGID